MEQYDREEIYCRMLGHHLSFKYCRSVQEKLPCRKIADCWFERIPVLDFLKSHYSEAEIETVFAPPKPRLTSILQLVEEARRRNG